MKFKVPISSLGPQRPQLRTCIASFLRVSSLMARQSYANRSGPGWYCGARCRPSRGWGPAGRGAPIDNVPCDRSYGPAPPRERDHGPVPHRRRHADLHRLAADARRRAPHRHHRDLVGAHRVSARGDQSLGRLRAARRHPRPVHDLRHGLRDHDRQLRALRLRAERVLADRVSPDPGAGRGDDRLGHARAGDGGDAGGRRGARQQLHDDGLSLRSARGAPARRLHHRSVRLALDLLPHGAAWE